MSARGGPAAAKIHLEPSAPSAVASAPGAKSAGVEYGALADHEHADQTHGIDDLRSVVLHQRRRIPVYLNQSTADHVLLRFSYCFVSPPGSDYPPILDHHSIENRRKPDHRR